MSNSKQNSMFSLTRLLLVARKEFSDLLRDRKSIFWGLFAVAISGPLVVGMIYFVAQSVTERIEKVTAPIVNAQFAPDLVRFLERGGIKVEADPADYEARVKSGDLDAVLVIDPDFAAAYASGRAARITLVTESSRDRSAPVASRLARAVRSWAEYVGNERLILRGVAPQVARPVQLDDLDLATAEQKGSRMLQIMSFYALFAGLMGAIAAALDVTAGEREHIGVGVSVADQDISGGQRPDGQPWRIAVERPDDPAARDVVLALRDAALGTSGDYRSGFVHEGRRYSHTLDPRTGEPIRHELAAVTVVADSAMAADARAAALLVLGPEAGYAYARTHGIAAVFTLRAGEGYARRTTRALERYLQP